MATSEQGAARNPRKWIYVGAVAVVIGLIIWAVLAFKNDDTNAEAQVKAQQLKSRLESAGLPSPEVKVIADTFGTDGGMVCSDPSNPLLKADYQAAISNGAGGPGARPVLGDRDVAEATSLAIATYCPDNLGDWLKQVRNLNLDNTIQS